MTVVTKLQTYAVRYLPVVNYHVREFIVAVYSRVVEIVKGPINNSEMLWILMPLLLATLLMEFYFERYSEEELGWNSAYGNSLVLLFVCIDLLRHLYTTNMLGYNSKFAFVIAVIFIGSMFTLLDFFHALPKSFAFVLSSRLPINCLALAAVFVVYMTLPLDYITFTALVLFIVLFSIVLRLLSSLIPTRHPNEREINE